MYNVNFVEPKETSSRSLIIGFGLAVLGFVLFSFHSASASASPSATSTSVQPERETSAWEQLCLKGTSAACDKASSILADRLIDTDDTVKETSVRQRLVVVSKAGCKAGQIASCSELVTADESSEGRALALKIAESQCKTSEKAKSESCQLKARLSADAAGTKDSSLDGLSF